MYTQLTFWLPNIQAQLMYIQYIQSRSCPLLVTIKNWSVIFSAAAYAFISLSNEGWFGLVSFVTVVAALVCACVAHGSLRWPLRHQPLLTSAVKGLDLNRVHETPLLMSSRARPSVFDLSG